MSSEQNKAIVRRYLEEFWGKGNQSVAGELLDKSILDHNPLPNQAQGIQGQRQALQLFHSAFKDLKLKVEYLIGEGDKVLDHWTLSGVHKGEFLGLKPTGKSFTITGTDLSRIENGKIAEVWHVEDVFGMLQQLGAIPASPEARPSAQANRPSTGRRESDAGAGMGR